MSSAELENLVKIGKLKREPPSANALEGLRKSAVARLEDAAGGKLSFESRFDLAYNAAHGFALYALRRLGYRSDNRYLVFQTLEHTAGVSPETWRVLAKAHERRNVAEYEGQFERDERLLAELLDAAKRLRATVDALPPPAKSG
jgi:hypothetical protein